MGLPCASIPSYMPCHRNAQGGSASGSTSGAAGGPSEGSSSQIQMHVWTKPSAFAYSKRLISSQTLTCANCQTRRCCVFQTSRTWPWASGRQRRRWRVKLQSAKARLLRTFLSMLPRERERQRMRSLCLLWACPPFLRSSDRLCVTLAGRRLYPPPHMTHDMHVPSSSALTDSV